MEPQTDDLTERTPTEDKTDQLIDHAKALIDTAKSFVTKPVSRKYSRKQPTAKPAKADIKPKALDVLHGVTMNKLATLRVEMDGSSRPSGVDSSIPKCRKIKCKMCMEIFGSVKDLNIHHKQDHGIVKCTKCDKYFSTQSSLDKHSYTHGELKFNCELCGKCFPFESRLDQYMLVHINNKLSCPKKSCDKQFKSIGDLNRHMKSHTKTKVSWYHCDHCDYKNKDKHNTEPTAQKNKVDMNVTNVAKKCDSAPSLKDTEKRVAKSKNCHKHYQFGILKRTHDMWKLHCFHCNVHLCVIVLI